MSVFISTGSEETDNTTGAARLPSRGLHDRPYNIHVQCYVFSGLRGEQGTFVP